MFIREIVIKILFLSVHILTSLLSSQDMEKEIRKQVDDAIAKAKVSLNLDMFF
jgi:hypothetical protein